MMQRIRESLIFGNILTWDNSELRDWKCAGRYMAAMMSKTSHVYFQDDDVIVPRSTQAALLETMSDVEIVANWGHGDNADGYDDLPLVCGGAIARKDAPLGAMMRYAEIHPLDQDFAYEADFAVGVLYHSFEHVHLPFDINLEVAQHRSRLCNQPWQRDLKLKITERARAIRDRQAVAA